MALHLIVWAVSNVIVLSPRILKMLDDENAEDPEVKFLKSLSRKDKKKLLR